jgi:branched-chain amino acid transport system permease protein
VISGAVAGISGVIGVFHNRVIAPDTADLEAAVLVLMAALVGGVTRLEGGILGAIVTVFLVNIASGLTLRYWSIVGIVFILIVLFLPNGLLSKGRRLSINLRRKQVAKAEVEIAQLKGE